MSILCDLTGEDLSTSLSDNMFDVQETDLSGWLNMIEGHSPSNSYLTSIERKTLSMFFGSARIRILSTSYIRASLNCFTGYLLFSKRIGDRLFVYSYREKSTINVSVYERSAYQNFMVANRIDDSELDAHIVSGHLRRISPELLGDYLSVRWPSQYTSYFSYFYKRIPVLIIYSRAIFWYGIHQQCEIGTPIVELKTMNFNHICRLIKGYSERKYITFDSESYFMKAKCCVCLEEKFCSSLCGKAEISDFLHPIPNSTTVMLDLFKIRRGEMGHMVCSTCKVKWRDSVAGSGCPICREKLYILDANLRDEQKCLGNTTSFHFYMLVRMICLNMLAPENIDLDQRLVNKLKEIINDYPRNDLISLNGYNAFMSQEYRYDVSIFEIGMVFGQFGGACVDIDYMLFKRYSSIWGGHVLANLGLRALRSTRNAVHYHIRGFEICFGEQVFNMLYDMHIATILSDVFEEESTDPDTVAKSLNNWFRRSLQPIDIPRPSQVFHFEDDDAIEGDNVVFDATLWDQSVVDEAADILLNGEYVD